MTESNVTVEEKYAPRAYFVKLVGFNYRSLAVFCKENDIEDEQNLPVFKIMKALKDKTKYLRDLGDLDQQKKYEEVMVRRIANQQKLGQLVPIAMAKERVRDAFLAVAKYIRYAAKSASLRVAICGNARECENIIINEYDNALDLLQKESKVVTWEQDSGETQLTRTELVTNPGMGISDGSSEEATTAVEG